MTHRPQRQTPLGALIATVVAAAANELDPRGSSAASPARTARAVDELSELGDHFNYAPKEQQ